MPQRQATESGKFLITLQVIRLILTANRVSDTRVNIQRTLLSSRRACLHWYIRIPERTLVSVGSLLAKSTQAREQIGRGEENEKYILQGRYDLLK